MRGTAYSWVVIVWQSKGRVTGEGTAHYWIKVGGERVREE